MICSCSAHSWMPSRPSACAFHDAIARRLRVEVATTVPSKSPEYMRSLSPEKQTTFTWLVWLRMRCFGVGGGGAAIIEPRKAANIDEGNEQLTKSNGGGLVGGGLAKRLNARSTVESIPHVAIQRVTRCRSRTECPDLPARSPDRDPLEALPWSSYLPRSFSCTH